MYISKLHLEGFKSFLNKTDLEFGEGVTAVVGPNGCGKSNIVDAIRWVLGEQKISILRSTKMEDVIFAGTEKLGEKGFAEVYLVFDLGDNNNFNSSEVSIGRKLYISPPSPCFLIYEPPPLILSPFSPL